MGFMSKVLIALRLIAEMATYQHVMSVENKGKINIGVNGVHVISVASFKFQKDNGYLSLVSRIKEKLTLESMGFMS